MALFLAICVSSPVSAQFSGAMSPVLIPEAQQISAPLPIGAPEGLIYLDSGYDQVFWVDMTEGVLNVLSHKGQNNFARTAQIPISIGKKGMGKQAEGDLKTPIGVYQLIDFFADERIEDKYGIGAFPLNYPNIWDRLAGRTGSGIWLHGLPKGVDQRPLLDSDGCVVIDNVTLETLKSSIRLGDSMIVLAESMNWLDQDAPQPEASVLTAIEQWRKDWESLEEAAYFSHYASNFTDGKRDLSAWKTYKHKVNKYKNKVSVSLDRHSVVSYPGETDLVVSRFYQIYRSNNFNWKGWKYLYWQKNDQGEWKIVYEGNG